MKNNLNDYGMKYVEKRGVGELAKKMGIEIYEMTENTCKANMPVEGNTQGIGLVHGGAYVVLGETLGSMHANFIAKENTVAVGLEVNATHTRSATTGYVTGECHIVHKGKKITVHEIIIADENGKRCSTVRITNMFLEKPKHARM